VLLRFRHPVHIITKGSLVLRDLDLLVPLAEQRLVSVSVSLTTLDDELKRIMEPRAAAPTARLRTLRTLHEAGVPVSVMCAPMIPMINDMELERLLEAARDAGAGSAGYVLLRLPHEVAPLFEQWLGEHFPQRAEHVMSLVRQSRGGKAYDSRFGSRMRGEGQFAELLAQRFHLASKRLGFHRREQNQGLDCSRFASMMPAEIAGPRAGVGRRVENAARFSTLRTVTVGWITLCLSTEGAGGSSLLLRLAHAGFPSMMPGKIAGPRAGAGRRVENALLIHRRHCRIEPVTSACARRRPPDEARGDRRSACWPRQTRGKRCAVFHPTHGNRRVDNAPLIHRRHWRIEPVTSACARRFPFDDTREDRRPRAGVGRRVENAVRFSTLRADNRRVDNAPLIHRRRWRIEPVTSACARRLP